MVEVPKLEPRRVAHAFYNITRISPYPTEDTQSPGETPRETILRDFTDAAISLSDKWFSDNTYKNLNYTDRVPSQPRFKKTPEGFIISPGGEIGIDIMLEAPYEEDAKPEDYNDDVFWRKYMGLLGDVYYNNKRLSRDVDLLACFLSRTDPTKGNIFYTERQGVFEIPPV